ncbi:LexA family protein [Methyloterricola oryzae]|uniref:LexA family protein n=1 Tax=Methyloterricola oryzae TaxID=1495050 RepID=UPI0005EB9FEE|nr:XRE family transcriptional regulator [Methyloterricola oryzae]
MSLALRIKQARSAARLTQRDLAKRSLLSQQMISKLENGLVESTTEVFNLAAALNVDPRWLATGQGEAMKSSQGGEEAGRPVAYVPLLSWVAAGNWRDMADQRSPADAERVPVTCRVGDGAYALRVHGDSMEPVFANGSIIVVDPSLEARNGSYVVVRLDTAAQATFKQLVIDGGQRFLKPLNPRYPLMEIREEATLCGVVKQMLMNFE